VWAGKLRRRAGEQILSLPASALYWTQYLPIHGVQILINISSKVNQFSSLRRNK
jgi:hypothetical protein